MIILSTPVTETKAKVVGSYLEDTQITKVTAQTLPDNVEFPGKNAVLYINPQSGEFTTEYVDRPLTEVEKLNQSEEEQAAMILALVMGGIM